MSREDNLPNTIIESLACGVPVISTGVGGIPEMYDLKKSGRIVTRDDSKSMHDALLLFVNNPELIRESKKNARSDAEKNYSPRIQASKYFELFRKEISLQEENSVNSCSKISRSDKKNNSQKELPIRIPAIENFPNNSYSFDALQWYENKFKSER